MSVVALNKYQVSATSCYVWSHSIYVCIATCFEMCTGQPRLKYISFSFILFRHGTNRFHSKVCFSDRQAILRTAGHSFVHPCNKLLSSLLCQLLVKLCSKPDIWNNSAKKQTKNKHETFFLLRYSGKIKKLHLYNGWREKERELRSKLISSFFGVKNKYSSNLLGSDLLFIPSL